MKLLSGNSPLFKLQAADHEFSDFVEGIRGSEHDPTVHRQRGTYIFTRHCDSWEGGLDSEGAADILAVRGDGSAIRILRESALGRLDSAWRASADAQAVQNLQLDTARIAVGEERGHVG